MEEIKCLECGKPVSQTPGRRKKEYCGSTCRSLHWKKKQQMGKQKRGPGRPPKSALDYPRTLEQEKSLQDAFKEVLLNANIKKQDASGRELFMGHPIPKGLKGIDLTIWKEEIKEKNKLK